MYILLKLMRLTTLLKAVNSLRARHCPPRPLRIERRIKVLICPILCYKAFVFSEFRFVCLLYFETIFYP